MKTLTLDERIEKDLKELYDTGEISRYTKKWLYR